VEKGEKVRDGLVARAALVRFPARNPLWKAEDATMTPPITASALAAALEHRTENHYCAGCRGTRAFLDRGEVLDCPLCRRRLHRVDALRRTQARAGAAAAALT